VREHPNQKYAYGHEALILLILLASLIGIEEVGVGIEVTTGLDFPATIDTPRVPDLYF
jgi:hypothetical protein